jgi:hypothetical protein
MGLFTKRSSTHFVRDENGKVISTTKTGYEEKKTRWDELADKRKEDRIAKQKERQERRYENRYQKQQESDAYRKARNEERIRLRSEQGRRSASHPATSMLPPRRVVHVHVGQKQYEKQRQRQTQHHSKPFSPEEFQKKLMKGFK